MNKLARRFEVAFAAASILFLIWMLILESDVTADWGGSIVMLFGAAICWALTLTIRIVRVQRRSELLYLGEIFERPRVVVWPIVALLFVLALERWHLSENARFFLSRNQLEQEIARTGQPWKIDPNGSGHWIGLYEVYGIEFDQDGWVRVDLGYCGMFGECWLAFQTSESTELPLGAKTRYSERWLLAMEENF